MRLGLGCACLIAIAAAMLGQARPHARPSELNIATTVPVANLVAQGIATPTKCDADGAVTLRLIQSSDLGSTPVTKISADGQRVVVFRLPSDGKPENPQLVDFAPTVGGLYALVTDKAGKPWLLQYGDDGRLERVTPLQGPMHPMQIDAAIPGELVISGTVSEGQGDNEVKPFIGAFSTGGDLLRELAPEASTKDLPTGSSPPSPSRQWNAMLGARLQAAPNGTIYLLRRNETGPVIIISPSGEVRQISLHPPEGATISSRLALWGGRLVVEFLNFKAGGASGELSRVTLQVIDSEGGNVLMNLYHANPNIGPNLACYDGNEFVFVNTDDNSRVELVKVKPH
jgi:hypothetical protein